GAVLAPDDDLVVLRQSRVIEPRREAACRATDLLVGMTGAPIPIVVDEKLAANGDEVAEEVDERVAAHHGIMIHVRVCSARCRPQCLLRRRPPIGAAAVLPPRVARGPAGCSRALRSPALDLRGDGSLDAPQLLG